MSLKGYEREAFVDSWDRYLPASPLEAKHRNTEHERSFDVSDCGPSDGQSETALVDLPVEDDYPRSAWDPNAGEELDQQLESWSFASGPEQDGGDAP